MFLTRPDRINKLDGDPPTYGKGINYYQTGDNPDVTKAVDIWGQPKTVTAEMTALIQFGNSQPFWIFHDDANPGN